MRTRKTLKELTLKDNFLFGAVMSNETNCRRLLELILQFPIEHVIVSKEKSIVYHPEYKGIRLDVFAKDENHTHYNVEMQAVKKAALGKRTRYYQSQIDMDLLLSGAEYSELPDTYVIFICDFDPFGQGKYCYTYKSRCLETKSADLQDGRTCIFLSTYGTNADDIPEEMERFLHYVKADLKESTRDFGDEYVRSLQKSVQEIKENREMEESFMIWHEMLSEERAEGKAEGKAEGRAEGKAEGKAEAIIELLAEIAPVPEKIRQRVMNETDVALLTKWLKLAAKSKSMEQFLSNM